MMTKPLLDLARLNAETREVSSRIVKAGRAYEERQQERLRRAAREDGHVGHPGPLRAPGASSE